MCPLLIEIVIEGDKQLFSLNSDEYSAYSYEQEVLLHDGVEYTVILTRGLQAIGGSLRALFPASKQASRHPNHLQVLAIPPPHLLRQWQRSPPWRLLPHMGRAPRWQAGPLALRPHV